MHATRDRQVWANKDGRTRTTYKQILRYRSNPESRGYEYKPGQKFASDNKKDISDPHPAILELASLNIVGIDVADVASRNDSGASFRDIQRYIMARH